jgi:broad specificity phosphatase PhoE
MEVEEINRISNLRQEPLSSKKEKMKIIIVRHGKPYMPASGRLKASEMHEWIESYNAAGIDRKAPPPTAVIEKATRCNALVCSDLKRSIESGEILKAGHVCISDAIFREFSLPCVSWSSFRLSPIIWTTLFRLLWFAGFSSQGESYRASKLRVKAGADKLREIAAEHGSVLFVGHGIYNYFLAKKLLSTGWQGPMNPGRRYWEFGVYTT